MMITELLSEGVQHCRRKIGLVRRPETGDVLASAARGVTLAPQGHVGPDAGGRTNTRGLLVSLGGIALLLTLHYTVSIRPFGVHDLLRRLFYVPVIGAAIAFGLRGGLLASAVALLGYVPHLTSLVRAGAPVVDPALELVLLPVVGMLVGRFADSSRRDRAIAVERARLAALGEVALAMMAQAEGPLASIQGQAESLRYLAEQKGATAVVFAARVISDEASRVRRFLIDLHGLRQGRKRSPSNVDLAALTSGVVADIQAGEGAPSRLALGVVSSGVRLRADARVLAYALRSLVGGLLDAVPAPRRLEVGVGPVAGGAMVQIRALYDGACPPGLDSGAPVSGAAERDDGLLRKAISVHLLTAEGGQIDLRRPSLNEALLTVSFREPVGDSGRTRNRKQGRGAGMTLLPLKTRGVDVLLTLALLALAAPAAGQPEVRRPELSAMADTAGMAQLAWVYDSWTVPWVEVRGASAMLAPGSNATLLVLACETADLERDRLVRHLSPEECDHRMAAIRADQDSALIFRLDLRALNLSGGESLVRLAPRVLVTLEDDQGHRWKPLEVKRGPAGPTAAGLKLKRIYYNPPWLRDWQRSPSGRFEVADGRDLTVAEHRVRFMRRDPDTGELIVSSRTRWLRLRISYGSSEWVATWTFRTGEEQ